MIPISQSHAKKINKKDTSRSIDLINSKVNRKYEIIKEGHKNEKSVRKNERHRKNGKFGKMNKNKHQDAKKFPFESNKKPTNKNVQKSKKPKSQRLIKKTTTKY